MNIRARVSQFAAPSVRLERSVSIWPYHAVVMRAEQARDWQARLREFYESLPPAQQAW